MIKDKPQAMGVGQGFYGRKCILNVDHDDKSITKPCRCIAVLITFCERVELPALQTLPLLFPCFRYLTCSVLLGHIAVKACDYGDKCMAIRICL